MDGLPDGPQKTYNVCYNPGVMSFRISFLGTGGGRYTTMYQIRSTGGMLVEHDGRFLHIDPGPGALTQMQRIHYDLHRTESLIVSHCHPDHYSDAESVLEGMSKGGWEKRGHLYGSETVVNGNGKLGPCVSDYHKSIVEDVTVFRPGDVLDVDGMQVDICRAIHSDPTNVGFRFHTADQSVRRPHGDAAHHIVPEMLRHLHGQTAAIFSSDADGVIHLRQNAPAESDVQDSADNLGNCTCILCCHLFLLLLLSIQGFRS